MIKKNKKLTHSNDDVKHYLGSLSEDFFDKIKVIGEQYIGLKEHLDKRFDQIEQKLDSHTEMIGNLMIDMETMKSVEPRVTRLETRITSRR